MEAAWERQESRKGGMQSMTERSAQRQADPVVAFPFLPFLLS